MCGIVGFWSEKSDVISKEGFDVFVDSLKHRGPDGRGVYNDTKNNVLLGHRRLTILDLSEDGSQPMSYLNKRYHITYNGEIYNFLSLKAELKQQGYVFKTNCDTEVVLAAYDYWGEDCLYKFNGMWAFSIWDKLKESFFLSRDRFGVKPCYYFFDGSIFAFASELKSFMKLSEPEIGYNKQFIQYKLGLDFEKPPLTHTFLKDVYELPPGSNLHYKIGEDFKVKQWWSTLDHLVTVPTNHKDRVRQFKELFYDACKLRMVSDIPIGVALSGGLDSSSVLMTLDQLSKTNQLAKRSSQNWNNTFVAAYTGSSRDEAKYAKVVNEAVGANSNYFSITSGGYKERINEMAYTYENVMELSLGPFQIFEAFKNNNIHVAVNGDGGDELLGGYDHLLSMVIPLYRRKSLKKYLNLVKTQKDMHLNSKSIFKDTSVWKDFLHKASSYKKYGNLDPINSILYHEFHFNSLPIILRNFDRISMANGIEVRAPFMDWRLVCYCFSLPGNYKFSNGYTKSILRSAMEGVLPNEIRLRKSKVGFCDPYEEWLLTGFNKLLLDIASTDQFQSSEFWDGEKIYSELLQLNKDRKYREMRRYWEFITTSILIDTFEKSRVSEVMNF